MSANSRVTACIISQLMILCTAATGVPQSSGNSVILARDVDKRSLQKVSMAELSPGMRRKVQALIDDARATETPADKNRATAPSLETTIYRIPVAPHGHKLYLVEQIGELACAPAGVNCEEDVFDETASGIDTVTNGEGAGVSVVRRPNLQMPDIAAYEQEGHFAKEVTVFRFDGSSWKPFLCKSVEPINDDPNPAIVADKPCKQ